MRLTSKTSSEETDILRLVPQCAYRCIPEDTTRALLFKDPISTNQCNVIKIVTAVIEKIDNLFEPI
jgi:hypothetical protein